MRTDLPSLPDAKEHRWGLLGGLPHWLSAALPVVATALASLGALCSGAWQAGFIIASVVLLVLGLFALLARRQEDSLAIERAKILWLSTLDRQISTQLQMLAELANTEQPDEVAKLASKVRLAAVAATAALCGSDGATGTRANLFRLQPYKEGLEMCLEPGAWGGRGDRSTRRFRHDDETMRYTLRDDFRFEPQVSDRRLAYETFLTFPVSEGPESVFGVLTIDCPRSGDISVAEDIRIMRSMAAIIALAYLLEGAPSYRAKDSVPLD